MMPLNVLRLRRVLGVAILLSQVIRNTVSASPHSRLRIDQSKLENMAKQGDIKSMASLSTSRPVQKEPSARSPSQLQRRLLVGTITSTRCPLIRTADSFAARLDLYYLYQVEFSKDSDVLPDLEGINRAVASSLAQRLDECNEERRPTYAIQLSETDRHTISSSK